MTLTDLEGATLAAIATKGATTAYAVAKSFAQSPSEFWSGSAGAVYPLIRRMTERGLLSAESGQTGKRLQQNYSVTPQGRAALEEWLLDAKRASGMGFDPLRTRLVHLDLVSSERRLQFLAEVREVSKAFAQAPAFEDLPTARKVHETWLKARASWLKMLDFI